MMGNLLQRWWYAFCQLCCQLGVLVAFRYRVWGREHIPRRGGALIVSNHQSYLDPVLVGVGLPRQVHYMARRSLFASRAFARLIRSLNAFPVGREEVDLGALREAVARLRRKELVLVFPEGTRTPDGSVLRLRRGVELLARQAGVPVLPVVIDGAHQAWPRHRLFPRPGPIRVLFGPPMELGVRGFDRPFGKLRVPSNVEGLTTKGDPGRERSRRVVVEMLAERLRTLQAELRRGPARTSP